MASNQTTNYGLHLWEPEDDFLRTEFNENNEAIDAALKEGADGLADALVQMAGYCRCKLGGYTGDGEFTKTIDFGVPAQAVILLCTAYTLPDFTLLVRGQTKGAVATIGNSNYGFTLTWGTNSATLTAVSNGDSYAMNRESCAYLYAAFY